MKREDLKKLLGDAATDEVIDSIMGMNGADIETHKTKVTELQSQFDTANAQLTEANTQIEKFKGMKPEELQAAADDYKTKWEQAQEDAKTQLAQVKFDHALEKELKSWKVKDPADVIPHLKRDTLKLGEDGKFIGLKEQLEPLKSAKDYLFEGTKLTPKIVTKTDNKSVNLDPFEAGLLKGANLTQPNEGN